MFSPTSLADTHCHLDFDRFKLGREVLVQHCRERAIKLLVVPSVAKRAWRDVLSLAESFDIVRPAFGLHPHFVAEHETSHLNELSQFVVANRAKVCAIGEIGLDKTVPEYGRQLYFFREQLKIAVSNRLPVIIHSRKSHGEVCRELKRSAVGHGVVHAYSGSQQDAEKFIALGMKIGVGGVITWPRARKTRTAITALPLNALVLETDAPDMPVVGNAKGEGSPLDVMMVFDVLCQLRGEPPEEIATALWRNSVELFA